MTTDSATREGATADDTQKQQLTDEEIDQQLEAQRKADETAEAERLVKEEQARAAADSARNPRLAEMERIAGTVNEARGKDLVDGPAGDDELEETAEEKAAREKKETQADDDAARAKQIREQAAAGEPTVITPETLGGFRFLETIDGKQREVGLDELVRRAQKEGSADYRLSEATKILEDAQRVAKDLREAKPNKDGKTGTETDDTDQRTEVNVTDTVKKLIGSLLDGKEEEAATLLTDVLESAGKGRAATPSVDEIASAAEARIARKMVLAQFNKDYSELVGDKHLSRMLDDEFATLATDDKGQLKALTSDEFDKALRHAGDKVQDWMKAKGAKPKTDTTADDPSKNRDLRQAAKENLDQTVGASRRSTSTAEPAPPSRSSVIAEIAKGRGQVI